MFPCISFALHEGPHFIARVPVSVQRILFVVIMRFSVCIFYCEQGFVIDINALRRVFSFGERDKTNKSIDNFCRNYIPVKVKNRVRLLRKRPGK